MITPQFPEVTKEKVMHNRDLIAFLNKEGFEKLKRDYAYAVAEGFESFIFMDREILCSYAKYMIEYLTPHFDQLDQL